MGDPKVGETFNPKNFINCHACESLQDVLSHVVEVDNDGALYSGYLMARPILPESKLQRVTEIRIRERLRQIVDDRKSYQKRRRDFVYLFFETVGFFGNKLGRRTRRLFNWE